jgi:AcrR family transcriptional regulator
MVTSGRRMTAGERRETIVEAAVAEFARTGLHGTSTEAIAARAGISQPYLFRLFGTKKDLFLACLARCYERLGAIFAAAAHGAGEGEALGAMGAAYAELLADREMLLMQMQMYAACEDPEVRRAASRGYAELWQLVQRLSGAPEEELRAFFATGMLLNVAAAMDLPAIAGPARWAPAHLRSLAREDAAPARGR